MKLFAKTLLVAGSVSFMLSAPAIAADGEAVYKKACKMCHATGMMKAPKTGDKEAWAPRIAQGTDTLNDHAINGFKAMPARGGKKKLTDDEVKAAVAYLVSQSQ